MKESSRLHRLLRGAMSSTENKQLPRIKTVDEDIVTNELPLLHISYDSPPIAFDLCDERGEADGQSFVFPPTEFGQETIARSPDFSDVGHTDSGIDSIQHTPRDGVSPITTSADSSRRPSWAIRPSVGDKCSNIPTCSLHPDDARFIRLPRRSRSNSQDSPIPPSPTDLTELPSPLEEDVVPVASRPRTLDLPGSSVDHIKIDTGDLKKTSLKSLLKIKQFQSLPETAVVVSSITSATPDQSPEPPSDEGGNNSLYDNPEPSTSKIHPSELSIHRWNSTTEIDDRSLSGESYSGISGGSDYNGYQPDSWCSFLDRGGRSGGMKGGGSNLSLQRIDGHVSNLLQITNASLNKSSASLYQYYVTVTQNNLSRPSSIQSRLSVSSRQFSQSSYQRLDIYSDDYIEPIPHKLTFTQTLAFPTLAPRELGKHHKRTDPHIDTERSLNRFAVVITILVLVLAMALVVGVLFKFLKSFQQQY